MSAFSSFFYGRIDLCVFAFPDTLFFFHVQHPTFVVFSPAFSDTIDAII